MQMVPDGSPVPYVFTPNTTIASSQVNADFTALVNGINAIPTPVSLQAFRNRLINGYMIVDQRNAGASQTPGSGIVYTVDRWYLNSTQASKFTAQQNAAAVTPPVGFSAYEGLTATASTAVGSTDYYLFGQDIEGHNIQDLNFGTASASAVSLSFWVYSSLTGLFAGALSNSGGTRSYVFTYSIGSANTWTYITIPNIPGDVTGTWNNAGGLGLTVKFSLGCGSTFQTTPGVWQGGNYDGTNTSVSVVSTNGATFYATGVQLEPGTVCTAFETRLFGIETSLCQRYYSSGYVSYGGYVSNGVSCNAQAYFPVSMRATPTVVTTSTANSGFPGTASSVAGANQGGFQAQRTANATGGGYFTDSCDGERGDLIWRLLMLSSPIQQRAS